MQASIEFFCSVLYHETEYLMKNMKEKRDLMSEIKRELEQLVTDNLLYIEEPMSKHTTFRIGGIADYYVQIQSKSQLKSVVEACKRCEVPFCIIGNGSNLLVGDAGYRGVIIEIGNSFNTVTCGGEYITAQAGAMLSKIARVASDNELTGFEFAAGIPGTIGGAMVMNAGAYGGEMKDVVVSATLLTSDGEIVEVPTEELELGYRTSNIAKRDAIVLGVKLQLVKGEAELINGRMQELKEQRVSKQPVNMPSAGSTFKRPEGYFAAKLIDDAGLRGYQVGGAQVSEKHCGFVVNNGNATAAEVMDLVEQVRIKVQEQYGVELELEVKRIGEF